jgi:signal transduction histidine kinase
MMNFIIEHWEGLASIFLAIVSIAIAIYSARSTSKDASKQIESVKELGQIQAEASLLAIETESMRLANMATNVLNLTKVENQTILTDIKSYNISEQIRTCVLLLENQWSTKNIELSLDFDEYEIFANEELLKQVFINLLDNAIKFSPDGGIVSVEIHEAINHLSVDIKNSGAEIPKDKIDKIFNKFYQADESHAAKGNGVGLAIVKKIVKLHAGRIAVTSEGGITTFTLTLPLHRKQVK